MSKHAAVVGYAFPQPFPAACAQAIYMHDLATRVSFRQVCVN